MKTKALNLMNKLLAVTLYEWISDLPFEQEERKHLIKESKEFIDDLTQELNT